MTTEIEALKKRLKKSYTNVAIWIKLGYAYFQNMEYIKAIDVYLEALKLKPEDAIN